MKSERQENIRAIGISCIPDLSYHWVSCGRAYVQNFMDVTEASIRKLAVAATNISPEMCTSIAALSSTMHV